jgi:hypothetical protein
MFKKYLRSGSLADTQTHTHTHTHIQKNIVNKTKYPEIYARLQRRKDKKKVTCADCK